ncbi:hypothetical protein OBBRIDRAFT_806254 [Obba rivulosa]|uniref:Uncharacterized protein n=1 Tax=Obba rivulosa TaxID=1052685 RepID=A0A8E2AXE4_9APHY|nr:hypothetical protein OBBRIDRAFT_806254 [Obba rivulosa]
MSMDSEDEDFVEEDADLSIVHHSSHTGYNTCIIRFSTLLFDMAPSNLCGFQAPNAIAIPVLYVVMHDRTTLQGSRDDEEPAVPWYVILGKKSQHKLLPRKPFIAINKESPFPIMIKCDNQHQGVEVYKVHKFIERILAEKEVRTMVDLIETSSTVLRVLPEINAWYPVVYGFKPGIYVHQSVCPSRDQFKQVNGYVNPKFIRLPTFLNALIFMISRGREKGDLMEGNIQAHIPVGSDQPACSAARPGELTCSTPSRQSRIFYHPPTSSPPSSESENSPSQALPTVQPSLSPTPTPPGSPSPVQMLPLFCEDPVKSVYQRHRELHGVQGDEYLPREDEGPIVSLGPEADKYVQCHGYTPKAILQIKYALLASSDEEGFIRILARFGLPLREGKYIYYRAEHEPEEFWARVWMI